jgi:hypothetical protein
MEKAFSGSHKGHGVLLAGKGAVSSFLEKVIDKKLLLQEARRIGLDQDAGIQKALANLRAKRAAEAFYRDEVQGKVEVSEKEITAAHERLGDKFEASHILVESREEAENAVERITGGEDFGDVAREVSRASTARKGGRLGIVSWNKIDPELEDKLWTLDKDQVSEPFETGNGWNLLYVIEKVPGEPPELEEARSGILRVLRQRETRRRNDALVRNLMDRWEARIFDEALVDVIKARNGDKMSPTLMLAEVAGEQVSLGRFRRRVNVEAVRQLPDAMALRLMRRLVKDQVSPVLLRKEALARGYGERPEVRKEVETLGDKLAVNRLLREVMFARLEINILASPSRKIFRTGSYQAERHPGGNTGEGRRGHGTAPGREGFCLPGKRGVEAQGIGRPRRRTGLDLRRPDRSGAGEGRV